MQWSSPSHVDSGTVFAKIICLALLEIFDFKIYVVIYLVPKLKILKILHLVNFDPLKIIWESTLLKIILKYIIDPSSCQKFWLLNRNCGLQYVLNTEKMAIFEAIFWTSHRRKQILGVYH